MNKRFTIAQLWQSYKEGVVPTDAPQTQIDECKLAFYGGAQVMLATFSAVAEMVTEDEGCQLLDDLMKEMDSFVTCIAITTSTQVQ